MVTTPDQLFLDQYIVTALWGSVDDDGNPLDDVYNADDIDAATLERMAADCRRFQAENAGLIDAALGAGADLTDIAHDFWLTRNRHGAGFWDGDYPEALGRALTKAAHAFGEFDLYVTDAGEVSA